MNEVITKDRIDPALKKLLDDLPEGDPDKDHAVIWTAWCDGEHIIPIGETVTVNMGTWYGPSMHVTEIICWVKHIKGQWANKSLCPLAPACNTNGIINPQDNLEVIVTVNY